MARGGWFGRNETVVWIHTGGTPGLFAYPETMARVGRIVD
jgi:L-cysteate sulfo-lyase